MYRLRPVDLAFGTVAASRVEVEHIVHAAPTPVWARLADHGTWDRWFPEMTVLDAVAPGGRGATRSVRIGRLVADERWIVWTPDRELALTVTRTNVPIARRWLEHVELVPLGEGADVRTTVRFTGHYEFHALARPMRGRVLRQIESAWNDGLHRLGVEIEHAAPVERS